MNTQTIAPENTLKKGNFILLLSNSNAPAADIMNIVEETEKAVKLQDNYQKNRTAWLPKKALKIVDANNGAYTFEMWFRKMNNGEAISKVWRFLYGC